MKCSLFLLAVMAMVGTVCGAELVKSATQRIDSLFQRKLTKCNFQMMQNSLYSKLVGLYQVLVLKSQLHNDFEGTR
jgi:CRISPR/Cas system-associated protein endoribonuclease Cas2